MDVIRRASTRDVSRRDSRDPSGARLAPRLRFVGLRPDADRGVHDFFVVVADHAPDAIRTRVADRQAGAPDRIREEIVRLAAPRGRVCFRGAVAEDTHVSGVGVRPAPPEIAGRVFEAWPPDIASRIGVVLGGLAGFGILLGLATGESKDDENKDWRDPGHVLIVGDFGAQIKPLLRTGQGPREMAVRQ